MSAGVCYFLMGESHGLQLLASLCALRKHYRGPVAILAPSGEVIPAAICADKRLDAFVSPLTVCKHRKNSALCTKTTLQHFTPFDPTLFLDADTIPVADVAPLFPAAAEECVWVRFSDWRVCGSPYEARVRRLADRVGHQHLLKRVLAENRPAVNTGVFSFWKTAGALAPIHALCHQAFAVFIPDECATQMLYGDYPHRLEAEKWNASPRHCRDKDAVRVWHCHGSKQFHRTTRGLFTRLLTEIFSLNFGNVRDWIDRDRWWPTVREQYRSALKEQIVSG